jgi:CxxC-x17-CxxC domain-containing protein
MTGTADIARPAIEERSEREPVPESVPAGLPTLSDSTSSAPMTSRRKVPISIADEDEELLLAAATRPVKPPKESYDDRPTFPAICDTCGTEIRVPFQPDGKRPTFCRDCFKNHQRAVVKARESLPPQPHAASAPPRRPVQPKRSESVRSQPVRTARTYVPEEAPISLSRAALVSPKKFRSLRERPAPDLGAVRNIIGAARPARENELNDESVG